MVYQIYIKHWLLNNSVVDNETLMLSIPGNGAKQVYMTAASVKADMDGAGSFEFSLEPDSEYYNSFLQFKTIVRVVYGVTTIFRGRVLNVDQTMWGTQKIRCEGDLNFLIDVVYPGKKDSKRSKVSINSFLNTVIDHYNSWCGDNEHKFTLGEVPGNYVSASSDQQISEETKKHGSSSWQTVSDVLNDLKSSYGGFWRTRYYGEGYIYLDWVKNYFYAGDENAPLQIGKNIIDVSFKNEISNLFTALVPVGSKSGEDVTLSGYTSYGHQGTKYIPVGQVTNPALFASGAPLEGVSLNEGFHSANDYANAIPNYGWIYKQMSFSDCSTQAKLYEKAVKWIVENYLGAVGDFTVTAIDLNMAATTKYKLMCGDKVKLIDSDGRGLFKSTTLVIKSVTYDLLNPEKNSYTIGIPFNQQSYKATTSSTTSSTNGGNNNNNNNGDGKTPTKAMQWVAIEQDMARNKESEYYTFERTYATYAGTNETLDSLKNKSSTTTPVAIMNADDGSVVIGYNRDIKYGGIRYYHYPKETKYGPAGWYRYIDNGSGSGILSYVGDQLNTTELGDYELKANRITSGTVIKNGETGTIYEMYGDNSGVAGQNDPATAEYGVNTDLSTTGVNPSITMDTGTGKITAQYLDSVNLQQLATDLSDLGIEVGTLYGQVNLIGAKTDQLEPTLANLITDLAKMGVSVTEISSQVVLIGQEINTVQADLIKELAALDRTVTSITSDYVFIGNRMDQTVADLALSLTEIEGIKATMTNISSDVIVLGQRISDEGAELTREIVAQGKTITNITTDVTNIESEIVYVKNKLVAAEAEIDKLTADEIEARLLTLQTLRVAGINASGGIYTSGGVFAQGFWYGNDIANSQSLLNAFVNVVPTVDANAGTVTLKFVRASSTGEGDEHDISVTFNRAGSVVTGAWEPNSGSENVLRRYVVRSGSIEALSTQIHGVSVYGTVTGAPLRKSLIVPLAVTVQTGEDTSVDVYHISQMINGAVTYGRGYEDAAEAVVWPGTNTSDPYFSVTVPAYSNNIEGTGSKTFTMSKQLLKSNAKVIIKDNDPSQIVASLPIGALYDEGWGDAEDAVVWPNAITETEQATFSIGYPLSTVGGNDSKTFTLSKGSPSAAGGYAWVTYDGKTVARISIANWYTSGWGAAANRVQFATTATADDPEFIITAPHISDPMGNDRSVTYALSTTGSGTSTKVVVKNTTSNLTVASLPIGTVYSAGVTDGTANAGLMWNPSGKFVYIGTGSFDQYRIDEPEISSFNSVTHEATLKVKVTGRNKDTQTWANTSSTAYNMTIDASDVYIQGWETAVSDTYLKWPSVPSTYTAYMDVVYKATPTASSNTSIRFKLNTEGTTTATNAIITNNDGSKTYAKLSIGSLYTSGWTTAIGTLTWYDSSKTGSNAVTTLTVSYKGAPAATSNTTHTYTLTHTSASNATASSAYANLRNGSGTDGTIVARIDITDIYKAGRDKGWTSALGTLSYSWYDNYGASNVNDVVHVKVSAKASSSASSTTVQEDHYYHVGIYSNKRSSRAQIYNGQSGSTVVAKYDIGGFWQDAYKEGWQDFYNAGSNYWKTSAQSTDGYVYRPSLNKTNWTATGNPVAEKWFKPDSGSSEAHTHSATIYKATTGYDSNDNEVYLGVLYYKYNGNYLPVYSSNRYWYYSSTSISASKVYW